MKDAHAALNGGKTEEVSGAALETNLAEEMEKWFFT